MDVWVEATDASCERRAEELAKSLGAGGAGGAGGAEGCTGPGCCQCCVLVFSESVARAVQRCARLRDQGVERLLMVAVSRWSLEGGAAWAALASGASDVLCLEDLDHASRAIAARIERWRAVDRLLESPKVTENLIGTSARWRSALRQVVEVAHFTDGSVLVSGESGTGKELVARLIHTLDGRPDKGPLVLIDCTTLRPELAGSELFGHERGAFTNAHSARDGALALADGGTLFLDEVGELPPQLQAELLRAVQEGEFKRLGSNHWRQSAFRLVCATHRDLEADVEAGRFRADLYYRLATWTCLLPSLAERREDVPPLVDHFLRENLGHCPPVDKTLSAWLAAQDYPGNVRQLAQTVARIAQRHAGEGPITIGDLPVEERPRTGSPTDERTGIDGDSWRGRPLERVVSRALAEGAGLKEIREIVADVAVRIAVDGAPDQKTAAARLGVSPRALQLRMAAQRGRSGTE